MSGENGENIPRALASTISKAAGAPSAANGANGANGAKANGANGAKANGAAAPAANEANANASASLEPASAPPASSLPAAVPAVANESASSAANTSAVSASPAPAESKESQKPTIKYEAGMSPLIVKVATCSLNQWVLDFEGNKRRIIESVKIAKAKGCTYRLGPELEITGYSCEDHFYELDTIKFAWKILGDIISHKDTQGILCDYSMPVLHNGVRYNCRIFCLNKKILLIRPKMWLADDGNYREERWFTPWSKDKIPILEDYILPENIAKITDQTTVKFGVGIIQTIDATIASEVCEELFTPESPNIMWGLEGVDIISNGSASHWQMGKRAYRHSLISGATSRNGGAYMYSNMLGCDGNRLVFDGNSVIYKNGKLLATGDHLSYHEVEVVTAAINLDDVRAHRSSIVSRGIQADRRDMKAPRIMVEDYVKDFKLACTDSLTCDEPAPIEMPPIVEEEEMGMGLSRYMWDYLCRSTAGGFFLPLSGGVDSGSTSLFVYYMCNSIVEIVNMSADIINKDEDKKRLWTFVNNSLNKFIVGSGGHRKAGYTKYTINAPLKALEERKITTAKLMNIMLHTCNMPTNNNTPEIRKQASELAEALGCYHLTTPIEAPFTALKNMVANVQFGTKVDADAVEAEAKTLNSTPWLKMEIPRYKSSGGDYQENLAIQNIQARLRMVTAYYMAQILPLHRWNQEYSAIPTDQWKTYYNDKQAALKDDSDCAKSKDGAQLEEPKRDFSKCLKEPDGIKIHNKIIDSRGGSPFLLVLASSNSDEALRGFFTKYDAGSADLNPIGSFSKTALRAFMKWIMLYKFFKNPDKSTPEEKKESLKNMEFTEEELETRAEQSYFEPLNRILNVTASPELTPSTGGAVQDDEVEIEMTYTDLYELGLLRKRENLGPYSMFLRLCKNRLGKPMDFIYIQKPYKFKTKHIATPTILSTLINRFFGWYGKNRSKMTILTPGIHATNYSPDDNRFDQRPFLYPNFSDSYQMNFIKTIAEEMNKNYTTETEQNNLIIAKQIAATSSSPATATAEIETTATAATASKGGNRTLKSSRKPRPLRHRTIRYPKNR